MGWFSFLLTNAFITSIILGGLKHERAANIDPSKIKNDMVRSGLISSLQIGESVYIAGKDFLDRLTKK